MQLPSSSDGEVGYREGGNFHFSPLNIQPEQQVEESGLPPPSPEPEMQADKTPEPTIEPAPQSPRPGKRKCLCGCSGQVENVSPAKAKRKLSSEVGFFRVS